MIRKITFKLLVILMLSMLITEGQAKVDRRVLQPMPKVLPDTASKKASCFLLKNENGKTINIAEQKGKIIFLNFWALSCIPCKTEMPGINELNAHLKNDTDILILPIDLDNDMAGSSQYMRQKGFSLSVYYTVSAVPEALFHGQLPTTVVIDKNGEIVFFHEGEDDYADKKFIEYIEQLLKNKP